MEPVGVVEVGWPPTSPAHLLCKQKQTKTNWEVNASVLFFNNFKLLCLLLSQSTIASLFFNNFKLLCLLLSQSTIIAAKAKKRKLSLKACMYVGTF
jgi:hypothetical protein